MRGGACGEEQLQDMGRLLQQPLASLGPARIGCTLRPRPPEWLRRRLGQRSTSLVGATDCARTAHSGDLGEAAGVAGGGEKLGEGSLAVGIAALPTGPNLKVYWRLCWERVERHPRSEKGFAVYLMWMGSITTGSAPLSERGQAERCASVAAAHSLVRVLGRGPPKALSTPIRHP